MSVRHITPNLPLQQPVWAGAAAASGSQRQHGRHLSRRSRAAGVNPGATHAPAAQKSPQQQGPKAKADAPSSLTRAFNLIRDSRTVMFIGLILVVLAGYTLIVSISYFAHIGTDQARCSTTILTRR